MVSRAMSTTSLPIVLTPIRRAKRPGDPVVTPALCGPVPGRRFARRRLAHAVELMGACMMILGYLALALFA